jgi:hypothetical protein
MDQRAWAGAATGTPPRWPAGKPRVLVEDFSGTAAVSDHSLFREAGFEVAVCSGPDESDPCPLTLGGRCELAESADVVLFALDADDPGGRAVLRAHLRPPTPRSVVVARRREASTVAGSVPEASAACTVLPAAASVGGQVRALRRALTGRRAPAP